MKACNCSSETCGCCEGTRKLTPISIINRPGLDRLAYRAGTHGSFLETMMARLSAISVEAPGADGQTIESFEPLRGLTTRSNSDPSIALLDGWATVADILTFYQERIANEGYLGTALERRSILELARLVGYALRPGVAATVFLAYTLEDKQVDPVEIPVGARSQSVPGPGESPQSFETSESLIAHAEWNNLQVRLKKPQKITFAEALSQNVMYVAGASLSLKKGDLILLSFGSEKNIVRKIAKAEGQFADDRTYVELQPVAPGTLAALPLLLKLIDDITKLALDPATPSFVKDDAFRLLEEAELILNNAYLGSEFSPALWARTIHDEADINEESNDPVGGPLKIFGNAVANTLRNSGTTKTPPATTDPSKFVTDLLKPPVPQAANALQLPRSLAASFSPGSDLTAQVAVNFAPELKDTFYVAWSNANVETAAPELESVQVFRIAAPLFGATAQKQPTYFTGQETGHTKGELKPPEEWKEWNVATDEKDDALFMDQAYDAILSQSFVLIDTRETFSEANGDKTGKALRQIRKVIGTQTAPRTAYGISGKTTSLTLADLWWRDARQQLISQTLRATLVYAQSETLHLVDVPITEEVSGQEIPLAELYNELTSGRWVIFSGERSDIPGVSGVKVSELLMISGLKQDYDAHLPGDKTRTTLILATPTAYKYKRENLTIYGNVVKATHGETRTEVLGSGDGAAPLQTFELKQPPLTFVPAPTAKGVESTLKIYVDNVEWHEVETLIGLRPKDRSFVTKTADDDKTSLIFGNGTQGARLPTGVLNVNATYRNGIGKGGNVLAEQISLLQTRPLGVKSVINPLRASGGADKEDRDTARENAPLATMSLDRLVSLQDYSDFVRTFAGIAKARAKRLSDRRRAFIHLTIAGVADIPIDPTSDLYRNLLTALQDLGDVSVPVQVASRELVLLILSANVRLQTDYLWEPVASAIRSSLLLNFGFQKRALCQPALLCEVISAIQQIKGVAYVDVDHFAGISEEVDLDELAKKITKILNPPQGQKTAPEAAVVANEAGYYNATFHTAQLAIFTAAVPDTIVLNQIK